jgi:hypothetical protein
VLYTLVGSRTPNDLGGFIDMGVGGGAKDNRMKCLFCGGSGYLLQAPGKRNPRTYGPGDKQNPKIVKKGDEHAVKCFGCGGTGKK